MQHNTKDNNLHQKRSKDCPSDITTIFYTKYGSLSANKSIPGHGNSNLRTQQAEHTCKQREPRVFGRTDDALNFNRGFFFVRTAAFTFVPSSWFSGTKKNLTSVSAQSQWSKCQNTTDFMQTKRAHRLFLKSSRTVQEW